MTRAIRRRISAGLLAVIVMGSLGGGAYAMWLRTPPPMPDSIDEAVALFASPRYRRLKDTRRVKYVMHVQQLADALPREDREALWERLGSEPGMRVAVRQAKQDIMVAKAREFAMADDAERQAMVDAFIAMAEHRRPDAPPPDAAEQARRRGEARERMQHYVQHGDPQNQAYMQEFWKAVRQRRRELGIR